MLSRFLFRSEVIPEFSFCSPVILFRQSGLFELFCVATLYVLVFFYFATRSSFSLFDFMIEPIIISYDNTLCLIGFV